MVDSFLRRDQVSTEWGQLQTFIEAQVRGLKLWIYTDGACVKGNGVNRVFEKWDFDGLAALREAFVRQVNDLLARSARDLA